MLLFKHMFECLNETVPLSNHNINFGSEIRKLIYNYALLSGGLHIVNIIIISYPSLTFFFGAQKNILKETVLLSTHRMCFGWEKKFN